MDTQIQGQGAQDCRCWQAGASGERISIDGIHYGEIKARLDKQMPSNAWLTIAIKEGKNREIRHVMEHLGYTVSRLLRLSYGPFQLGKMTEASIEEVKPAILKEQLAVRLMPL